MTLDSCSACLNNGLPLTGKEPIRFSVASKHVPFLQAILWRESRNNNDQGPKMKDYLFIFLSDRLQPALQTQRTHGSGLEFKDCFSFLFYLE